MGPAGTDPVGVAPTGDGREGRSAGPATAPTGTGTGEGHGDEGRSGGLPDPDVPPMTVAPTPVGVARAVTAASAALATTGPRRSHPACRARPPTMAIGERTRVPDRLADRRPDVDATIALPADRSAVLVAAPLAYYLPAEVQVREDCRPGLLVSGERRVTFEDLERDAAALLRRVFHLDCLVRREPDAGGTPPERTDDLLARADLDPARLRSLSAEDRLLGYLDAWDARFDDALPEWHLATAVAPTPAAVRSLPWLLDGLSLIVRPDGASGRADLLDRTLADAYRTGESGGVSDQVARTARSVRSRAWLAPGRPIDAFKPTATAFEHRRRYRPGGSPGRSVVVVLGDDRMHAEYEAVAEAYRAAGDGVTVEVVTAPTRVDLLSCLGAGRDLLHYVGHCDEAGLRCSDGHLAAADVAPCRTPAFVLNACGSYDEGLSLVERGAVAGAVTFTDVLDRHAARVGTALARLLVDGFGLQRALEIARRRILMGQDYAAVGDATFAPWPERRPPGVLWIEPADGRASPAADSPTPAGERAAGERAAGDERTAAGELTAAGGSPLAGASGGDGRRTAGGATTGDGPTGGLVRTTARGPTGVGGVAPGPEPVGADGARLERSQRTEPGRGGERPGRDGGPAEEYDVTFEAATIRRAGDRHPVPFADGTVLDGETVSRTLRREELATVLDGGSFPVVWAGDLFRSDAVRNYFRPQEG